MKFLLTLLLFPTLVLSQQIKGVYFSPHGGCQDTIISEISRAKSSIYVGSYRLTNRLVLNALTNAAKKKRVYVILDPGNSYAFGKTLQDSGAFVYSDTLHAIYHNKFMVFDSTRVITGSYNFSSPAEHNNAENIIVFSSQQWAIKYIENWLAHKKHSSKW